MHVLVSYFSTYENLDLPLNRTRVVFISLGALPAKQPTPTLPIAIARVN